MTIAMTAIPQRARGAGQLAAKRQAGRTRLDIFYQEGCAKIRLPETFDGTMEAVLINTAGGLTGGDVLDWRFDAGEGTALTLTTQACEKIYKASAGTATVGTTITVGAGARVDWLPQETILFDNASLTRRLEVDLAPKAEFLAVEAVILGRKAMGETMQSGLFRDRWRIRRAGRLIHAEETRMAGDIGELTQREAVLGGNRAFATLLYCSPRAEALIDPLRAMLDGSAGASHWQDKLIARIVAADGFTLRKILIPVISHLRHGASLPKVWTL
ncbi:urease accessory protein UreD [Phyllobacterium leguminum]|uniref:Urease accessory protein UreD n=1 Tax=Phyllobacterium leguminum TaxID=314237 RepID=A0A318SZJ5_9HYPH|nr:urease accessory protein UreD [Phyllobacterium leguminum]PYE87327.1 urease accessory protein [Phyllobacterium leguminum]